MERRKPLQRKTPLKPGTPLQRKTPLRAVADPAAAKPKPRKRAATGEAAARRFVGTRSDGWCEVRIPDACDGRATDWQHRKNRSQRGKWRASNGLDACRSCHAHIHANPAEATEKGWTVPSYGDEVTTPVLLARPDGTRDWFLLADDGSVSIAPWPAQTEGDPFELGGAA